MSIVMTLRRILFPPNLDVIFSEEGKEKTALGIASRFACGNINVQSGRVTTQRKFDEQMAQLARRVSVSP